MNRFQYQGDVSIYGIVQYHFIVLLLRISLWDWLIFNFSFFLFSLWCWLFVLPITLCCWRCDIVFLNLFQERTMALFHWISEVTIFCYRLIFFLSLEWFVGHKRKTK
jgi:hypothetical protein